VRHAGLLADSYDCVDRIVLNAYYPIGTRNFRAFLTLLPKPVQIVEADGPDITVELIEELRKTTRTRKS
jgi:hypothetical protein